MIRPQSSEASWHKPIPESSSSPVAVGQPVRFASRVSRSVFIRARHELSDRKSWSNLTLTVIHGTCRVVTENHQWLLGAEETVELPAHCEHRLIAESDVRAVVTFDALQ